MRTLRVAVVAATAFIVAARGGLEPLRPGRWMYLALAALLAWIFVEVGLPVLRDEPVAWQDHFVSAGKLGWYALLAPAVPLLLRQRRETQLFLRALIVLSVTATAWGALQFLGLVNEFEGRRPAQREPSFLGVHDFAALSGAVLGVALILFVPRLEELLGRRWCWLAIGAGSVGVALSGAMAAVLGVWLASGAVMLASRRLGRPTVRRVIVAVAIVAVTTLGAASLRGSSFERFAEFIGLRDQVEAADQGSFVHRSVLAYIGIQIFRDHPLLGVGWQASGEEWAYGPQLDAARARFPDEPDWVFPSAEHPWGVQNGALQVLSDLGLVGLGLVVALVVLTILAATSGIRAGPFSFVGAVWLLVALGVWTGYGLVSGVPVAALTWLALGMAALRA